MPDDCAASSGGILQWHPKRRICGLLPAAGLSRRMGAFKPLLPLRGRTVIENSVDSLLDSGTERVVVVLGYRGEEIRSVLERRYRKEQIIFARNEAYARSDMLASIRIGLAAMPECSAFFLLPADMPDVSRRTCQTVRAAVPEDGEAYIVFPEVDGRRKHPPLIDSRLIPEIRKYSGPDGMRGFWRLHEELIRTAAVEDPGCCLDLDTPAQYRACIDKTREENEWKQSQGL